MAGAVRVERAREASIDTAIFFPLAFSAGLAFIAPGVDVAWANETVPLLGRGAGGAALDVSLAIADFVVKLAIAVFALAPFRAALGLVPRSGRVKIGLAFCRDAATIGATETSERR